MKVVTTFVRRIVVLVRSLADESGDFPLPEGHRLAVLSTAELPLYLDLRPDQDPGAIRSRIARGDLCFAILTDARLVHATWASVIRAPLPYLYADVVLAEGDVALYDSYTDPAWRRLSLSRCRDELCRRYYGELGLKRTLALIAPENVAGLRVAEPLGYRAIGEYGLVRVGPLHRRWVRGYGGEPMPALLPRSR